MHANLAVSNQNTPFWTQYANSNVGGETVKRLKTGAFGRAFLERQRQQWRQRLSGEDKDKEERWPVENGNSWERLSPPHVAWGALAGQRTVPCKIIKIPRRVVIPRQDGPVFLVTRRSSRQTVPMFEFSFALHPTLACSQSHVIWQTLSWQINAWI